MVNNTSVLFEKHLKGFFEAILLQRYIQELMDFPLFCFDLGYLQCSSYCRYLMAASWWIQVMMACSAALQTLFQDLVLSSSTTVSECLLHKISASSTDSVEEHRASHFSPQLK